MTKAASAPEPKENHGLDLEDFRLLPVEGLNESIRTSQAMIWYEDRVILGTGRAPLGFMGRYTARQGNDDAAGQRGADRADSGARDEDGAQVWRFDPATGTWDFVYDSPVVEGRDGKTRARDRSIRAATVYQTKSDPKPALYLGVGSLERQVVFLRSLDGENYEECAEHGFGLGDEDVPSIRNICGLNGRLYSTPTGKNYGRGMLDDNMTDFPMIYETDDPLNGGWRPVSEPGFGDPNNLSINELVVFNNHLYAATLNTRRGYQVWKTDARGKAPYRWTMIVEDGAYRGPTSSIPASMAVFGDALYIGGTLQRQGRHGMDRYGPFAAEMVRIYADDSWDIVCGTARFTPHGLKRPVSGMQGGFDDLFTHAFWRMAVCDGWFYVGTAGWRWMPTYLFGRNDITPEQLNYLRQETRKRVDGEFSLWRTRDGIDWQPITTTGFGSNPNNYGIRELTSTPVGLFVAPTSKQGAAAGGGLEIWWGHKERS